MPDSNIYDVLGLVLGCISLLAFVKHIRNLIADRLPPGRVRALERTIVEVRTLLDRLERRSRSEGTAPEAWAKHREILDGFVRPVDDLWLEVARWGRQGLARFRQVNGSAEFARLYADLSRRADECHNTLAQHLDTLSNASPADDTERRATTDGDSSSEEEPGTLWSRKPVSGPRRRRVGGGGGSDDDGGSG